MINETRGVQIRQVNFEVKGDLVGIAPEYCRMHLRLFSRRRYFLGRLCL